MSPGLRNRPFGREQERLAAKQKALRRRAGIIQSIRRFFIKNGYLEVETPHIIQAPAPESHIDAINTEAGFLHTSPELSMKRLISAGYSKIFQIGKCFRRDEKGRHHLPEFTLLEWYCCAEDYCHLMDRCEELLLFVLEAEGIPGGPIAYQGQEIDITGPWPRVTLEEAFRRYASVSMGEAIKAGQFDTIVVEEIEPALISSRPVFLYDYPASQASLARLKAKDPSLAERFELYVGGLELANGFSELTDVPEQRDRFLKEQHQRQELGKTPYPMPEKFLEALAHMPPCAGIALGVDRLVMLFSDKTSIDQVVTFTPEEV
ncbi:MAG: EF-P lysine aminoacylase GenX [Deltaproteobacteria bacterium]|nr:EF-P lysine aminoacylase GenX [Deltaproteobacteria bacterium]